MTKKMTNAAAIFAAVAAGEFCDCGHYYCPQKTADGGIVFPSGGRLSANGVFRGPKRLAEQLQLIPEDYRPEPVEPDERYPAAAGRRGEYRRCRVAEQSRPLQRA